MYLFPATELKLAAFAVMILLFVKTAPAPAQLPTASNRLENQRFGLFSFTCHTSLNLFYLISSIK